MDVSYVLELREEIKHLQRLYN